MPAITISRFLHEITLCLTLACSSQQNLLMTFSFYPEVWLTFALAVYLLNLKKALIVATLIIITSFTLSSVESFGSFSTVFAVAAIVFCTYLLFLNSRYKRQPGLKDLIILQILTILSVPYSYWSNFDWLDLGPLVFIFLMIKITDRFLKESEQSARFSWTFRFLLGIVISNISELILRFTL